MKKLQVARFLSVIIVVLGTSILKAATQDTNNYSLDSAIPGHITGYPSRTTPSPGVYVTGTVNSNNYNLSFNMNGAGAIYLANSNNNFGGNAGFGVNISNGILGLGYPPNGSTSSILSTINTNSYMGWGRTIIFSGAGGILELGCDMSTTSASFRSNTTGGAIIRAYNQTSAFTLQLGSHIAGVTVGGAITVGAGATVRLGFPLPVGSGGTQYSAFNVGGTATNSGTLRLFNAASTSTAAMNVNAYGILDCSLCTTASNAGLSSGTLTVRANGTLRFPNATGNFTKAIVLSP
jgi:hypothetical protein